jgi:peptidylprolyl isomerase
MKKVYGMLAILSLILMSASCEEDKYPELTDGIYAEINTTKGTMLAELYYKDAPLTVANFVALAEGNQEKLTDSLKGKPFYDGLIFHRVIKDFMIQGGDPSGTGGGDIGYKFNQEVNDSLKHDSKGILSMANAGPNTNGSQFFIMHKENPGLDMRYNVFGKVVEGLTVIDSIANVKTLPRDRPEQDVVMNSVKIIRKGKEAKNYDAYKTFEMEVEKSDKQIEQERMEAERMAAERAEKSAGFISAKAEEIKELEKKASQLPGSEIKVLVTEKGSGEKPVEGASVILEYSGYLTDGTLFDSSSLEVAQNFNAVNPGKQQADAYRPIPMQYTSTMSAIPGFKDAVLSMTYGQEIVAFIPAALGYGENANGPIPANSDLVFELKLGEKQ